MQNNKVQEYKLIYSDGCSYSTTINDKELVDLNEEDTNNVLLKRVLKHLIDKEEDLAVLQHIFEEFLESNGKEKDLGYCEQCGSYNTEYSMTVKF